MLTAPSLTLNAAHPLARHVRLVTHPLDNGPRRDWTDRSGRGNHLTGVIHPSFPPDWGPPYVGPVGYASFDRYRHYTTNTFSVPPAFSVGMWVSKRGTLPTYCSPLSWNAGSKYCLLAVYADTTPQVWSSGTGESLGGGPMGSTDLGSVDYTWRHILFCRTGDGGDYKFFVDGRLTGTYPAGTFSGFSSATLNFASRSDYGGQEWSGRYGGCVFLDRGLSDGEAKDFYLDARDGYPHLFGAPVLRTRVASPSESDSDPTAVFRPIYQHLLGGMC